MGDIWKLSEIHDATLQSNFERAKAIVEQNPNQVGATDLHGDTALHFAAEDGSWQIAKLLLEHGANPNAPNEWGITPLHRAAAKGHGRLVQLLIENGAAVHRRTGTGKTPLHYAAFLPKNWSVAQIIEQNGAIADLLANLYLNRLDRVAEQLEDQNVLTALPFVDELINVLVQGHHLELLQIAIGRANTLPRKEELLNGALIVACNDPNSSLEIANLLLKAGADPNCKNWLGESATTIASRAQNEDIATAIRDWANRNWHD